MDFFFCFCDVDDRLLVTWGGGGGGGGGGGVRV